MAEIRPKLPANTTIELWRQDEARIGQKNKITRRWAKRGTRPSAPKDQRNKSVYIFGAICPARGVGAALILNQAGWHTTGKLNTPSNITLLPLPPRAPELNPVENILAVYKG